MFLYLYVVMYTSLCHTAIPSTSPQILGLFLSILILTNLTHPIAAGKSHSPVPDVFQVQSWVMFLLFLILRNTHKKWTTFTYPITHLSHEYLPHYIPVLHVCPITHPFPTCISHIINISFKYLVYMSYTQMPHYTTHLLNCWSITDISYITFPLQRVLYTSFLIHIWPT